jgi:hypothetical protein
VPDVGIYALGMHRIALLLLLAVLAAGCSQSTDDPPEATIPSSEDLSASPDASAGATTTTLGRLGLEQATLEFTSCMREQGIDTPDIRLDAQGRPVLDELIDAVDTTTAEFRVALAECATILTRAGALDLRTDPELQAVIIDQLQEFSECARREGLRDFPDPDPAFTGTGSPYPLDEVPFSDPAFQKALVACQALLGNLTVPGG